MRGEARGEARVYESGGINWNWYVGGVFDDEALTVEVGFHERWHKGEGTPASLRALLRFSATDFEMMEDAARVVYGVRVGKREYLVTNPGPVFGYRDFGDARGTGMTIVYQHIGEAEDRTLHDVVSFRRVSAHGFEAAVEAGGGTLSRVVLKDVERVEVRHSCLCHGEGR